MKFSSSFFSAALLVGALAFATPAHAELITAFNFNDYDFVSDAGARSSTITNNFNSGDVFAGDGGTLLNSDPDDGGPSPDAGAGGALRVYSTSSNGTISNQGKVIQFGLDTTGYQNLVLDFATQNPNGGFSANTLQYSSDGTNFLDVGSYAPATTYGLQTFDLSSITALNNNANAAFRFVFTGGSTNNGSARNDLDNIAVNGVAAVPEPSTWAMMALGVGALGLASRKRKRGEAI